MFLTLRHLGYPHFAQRKEMNSPITQCPVAEFVCSSTCTETVVIYKEEETNSPFSQAALRIKRVNTYRSTGIVLNRS